MNGEGSLFDLPPAAIGRFDVLHELRAGVVGPIFHAEDPETREPVAINVLRMNLSPERAPVVAAALARLIEQVPRHDGLATPVAAGLDELDPYLAAALPPGEPLDTALSEFGPADITDVVPRLRLLADALDAAAARGLCHGALTPADVLVSPRTTMITGTGVAGVLAEAGVGVAPPPPHPPPEMEARPGGGGRAARGGGGGARPPALRRP